MNELSSLFGQESPGRLGSAANPSGNERSAGKIIIAIGTRYQAIVLLYFSLDLRALNQIF
jgi:hypothetical protein